MVPLDHSNIEEFEEPEHYDAAFGAFEPEGPLYLALAVASGGPVLDLACGTGRLAMPIARRGLPVVGVDLSRAMLARAEQRSAGLPVRYLLADCRSLELEERFACALMTGHAFQFMLTEDDQRALLAGVHRHLKRGGVFAFESRNPRPEHLAEAAEPEFWRSYQTDDGRWFDLLETRTCDPDQPIVHYVLHRRARDTGEDISSRTVLRFPGDAEIRRRLQDTGFALEALYGDWDRTPVTPECPELIYVCRRD